VLPRSLTLGSRVVGSIIILEVSMRFPKYKIKRVKEQKE
jgi:hypothetical protein